MILRVFGSYGVVLVMAGAACNRGGDTAGAEPATLATKVAPEPGSAEALAASVMCACGGGPTQQCLRGK